MDNIRNTWKNKPGVIILSVLLILVILVLLIVLFVRGVVFRADTRTSAEVPVVTQSAPEAQQPVSATATETVPPTKVLKATATAKATATPKPTATPTRKPTATKSPTRQPTPKPTDTPVPPKVGDVLKNGDFESGFGENGVAIGWQGFSNGGAVAIFAPEAWAPAIHDGSAAQRITITEGTEPNRYAGIAQTVSVVPGASYTLTLFGQVRTTFGDVAKSNYGYRMQYAVDWSGGTDWQAIPDDEWIELPWDEQLIDGSNMFFLDYTTVLVPPSDSLTLFIRGWNKWPDQLQAQYTLDSLSLIGLQPVTSPGEPLPETGGAVVATASTTTDPRVWGGALLILALLAGSIWRRRSVQS